MKKSLLLGWCLVAALAVQAQVWTAPAVPGEDLTALGSSEIVYVYNVEADAFLMYGMTSNTQACAARLTNGDYTASIPNQSYVFSTTDGRLRMRNKEKGNSYYIACPSDMAATKHQPKSKDFLFMVLSYYCLCFYLLTKIQKPIQLAQDYKTFFRHTTKQERQTHSPTALTVF